MRTSAHPVSSIDQRSNSRVEPQGDLKSLEWPKLLELLRSRSERGAAEFVRRYQPFAKRITSEVLVDKGASDEVAQDALFSFIHRIDHFNPQFAPTTLLGRIARSRALDRNRRGRTKAGSTRQLETDSLSAASIPAVGRLLAEEERLLVRRATEQLPPHEQQLISFTVYQRKTLRETSMALQIPLGTVKSGLFRARENLRRIIMELREAA